MMANRSTMIGHLIAVDPIAAVERVVSAYRRAGCRYTGEGGAAEDLGVSAKTFRYWVRKLRLEAELARIREQAVREGWLHDRNRQSPGRPKKVPS